MRKALPSLFPSVVLKRRDSFAFVLSKRSSRPTSSQVVVAMDLTVVTLYKNASTTVLWLLRLLLSIVIKRLRLILFGCRSAVI